MHDLLFWYLSNSFGALSIDKVVYSVSGYNFITGRNILMYLEHPPLVKYLIGLSKSMRKLTWVIVILTIAMLVIMILQILPII